MTIDLKAMLKAGVHFGHRTSRWSPKMRPFIWGAKNKIHLIDVSKTAFLLERAGTMMKDLAATGGVFLFVGTKKAAQETVQKTATALGMPYVIHRWVGGTLSNYEQVKKAITRLMHLRDVVGKSTTTYKKKEIGMIQKEIMRLEKNIGGIIELDYPPAGIVVIDAKKEQSAVKEASRLGIPVIGLVDTNTDPDGVSYIIPSNDDSPKAISFVLEYLEARVQEGKALFADKRAAELEAKRAAKAEAAKNEKPASIVAMENAAAQADKKKTVKAAATKETKSVQPETETADKA
jgi:small subunit ribosomal protein S2